MCYFCEIGEIEIQRTKTNYEIKLQQLQMIQSELDRLKENQKLLKQQLKPNLKEKIKYGRTFEKQLEKAKQQQERLQLIINYKEMIIDSLVSYENQSISHSKALLK